jgi:hypothetical protein
LKLIFFTWLTRENLAMTNYNNLRAEHATIDWAKNMAQYIIDGNLRPSDLIAYQQAIGLADEATARAFATKLGTMARAAEFIREENYWLEWHYRMVVHLKAGGSITLISPHLRLMGLNLSFEGVAISDWPEGWDPDLDEEAA